MTKWLACLVLLVSVPSCISAVSVSTWDPDRPDGLPFFAKVGRLKQKTVRARTWLDVTLTVLHEKAAGDRSKPSTMRIAIPEGAWAPKAVSDALAHAAKVANGVAATPENLPVALRRATEAFVDSAAGGLPSLDPLTLFHAGKPEPLPSGSSIAEHVMANEVSIVAEPDYSNPLGFNVRAPFFSSATASLDVAPDGTLAKASAGLDTSKLADAIPLKDYLSAALGLASAASETVPKGVDRFVVLAEARVEGLKFTLTRTLPLGTRASKPGSDRANVTAVEPDLKRNPLTFLDAQSVTRSPLNAPPAGDDDDKIQFSGSVALPKS